MTRESRITSREAYLHYFMRKGGKKKKVADQKIFGKFRGLRRRADKERARLIEKICKAGGDASPGTA